MDRHFHLRSQTKQQTTSIQQGQLECNPSTVDPPECNPVQTEVNEVKIAPKDYSLMQWTHTLLRAKRVSKHKTPVAARCTLMVAMTIYKLKCNQTKVKTTLIEAQYKTNSFSINDIFLYSQMLKEMNFHHSISIHNQK